MKGAGARNRFIFIERRDALAVDEFGKKVGWSRVCGVWAEVLEATARERNVAQGTLPVRAATVTMLYREGITAAMRVVRQDGTAWNITGLCELGFRRELQMTIEFQDTPTRG